MLHACMMLGDRRDDEDEHGRSVDGAFRCILIGTIIHRLYWNLRFPIILNLGRRRQTNEPALPSLLLQYGPLSFYSCIHLVEGPLR